MAGLRRAMDRKGAIARAHLVGHDDGLVAGKLVLRN